MRKTFTSGRDAVGYLFYWGLLIALFAFMYFFVPGPDIVAKPGPLVTTGVLTLGIWIWLFITTKYVLTDEFIEVKYLGFTWDKIKIDQIKSIERTYNPLAAPALSIKRLWVIPKNGKDLMMISPTPEKEFLKLIKELNPGIEIKV